jgi:hypothetical protein
MFFKLSFFHSTGTILRSICQLMTGRKMILKVCRDFTLGLGTSDLETLEVLTNSRLGFSVINFQARRIALQIKKETSRQFTNLAVYLWYPPMFKAEGICGVAPANQRA